MARFELTRPFVHRSRMALATWGGRFRTVVAFMVLSASLCITMHRFASMESDEHAPTPVVAPSLPTQLLLRGIRPGTFAREGSALLPQRTQRVLRWVLRPMSKNVPPLLSPKKTPHSGQGEPPHGGDDQNPSSGVFGNAVWSMGGPDVTVWSTMESNSLSVGRRKPKPADEQ